MANILVTGGAGYKGTVLVPALLSNGHRVTVVDPCWFGEHLAENSNLQVYKSNAKDIDISKIVDIDIAILLHSVANDPCSDLDPVLTWETACHETDVILRKLCKTKCSKVIYASSASIYGIRDEEKISEDLEPVALTVYNKTKVIAERIVLSYPNFNPVIIRPATVCGLAPRMRLDTVVNMLTIQAVKNKQISVYGGDQYRPNVHIDDLINAYLFFIANQSIEGVFNVGNDVRTVSEIAKAISLIFDCKISKVVSNDPRSYRLDSSKICQAGFTYTKNIDNAISEVGNSFLEGKLEDKEIWYNLKWMKKKVLDA